MTQDDAQLACARGILRDLERRKAKWLRRAAETMTAATLRDWKMWKKSCT